MPTGMRATGTKPPVKMVADPVCGTYVIPGKALEVTRGRDTPQFYRPLPTGPNFTGGPSSLTFVVRAADDPAIAVAAARAAVQALDPEIAIANVLLTETAIANTIDAPRFRHMSARTVALEPMDARVRSGLEALGHDVVEGGAFGGAQAILKLERGWAAGSDPRKDGLAIGY